MSWYYGNSMYYSVIIKKYVYIPYYYIHLSLLYMYGNKLMYFDIRNYVYTICNDLLVFTSYIYILYKCHGIMVILCIMM